MRQEDEGIRGGHPVPAFACCSIPFFKNDEIRHFDMFTLTKRGFPFTSDFTSNFRNDEGNVCKSFALEMTKEIR